jgi:hypothetical protein
MKLFECSSGIAADLFYTPAERGAAWEDLFLTVSLLKKAPCEILWAFLWHMVKDPSVDNASSICLYLIPIHLPFETPDSSTNSRKSMQLCDHLISPCYSFCLSCLHSWSIELWLSFFALLAEICVVMISKKHSQHNLLCKRPALWWNMPASLFIWNVSLSMFHYRLQTQFCCDKLEIFGCVDYFWTSFIFWSQKWFKSKHALLECSRAVHNCLERIWRPTKNFSGFIGYCRETLI